MDQLQKDHFLKILEKYQAGTASKEEIEFLDAYYEAFGQRENYTESLNEDKFLMLKNDLKSAVLSSILSDQINNTRSLSRKIIRWSAAAAAVVILASSGLFYYSQMRTENQSQMVELDTGIDISPGGNKAILTLANGKKISLTDAVNGVLAEQSGVQITKTADGQIIYTVLSDPLPFADGKVQFNTIETPKGGQYQLVLPDGSKVWINADSKMTYPSTFAVHKERRVKMEGEAYFEVSKNKNNPFIVETVNQEIEVLGTQFNVNSYKDESAVKTTLLEGSVKIRRNNGMNNILEPGQQAILTASQIKVNKIDPELAVAWKNNLFIFESDDIRYIMRMISRWYNVKIEYEGAIPDDKFGGAVSRFENVSEVLKPLEATGKVKFKIEGDRIIVKR